MTETDVVDFYHRAVVSFKGIACHKFGRTVVQNRLPVGTHIQNSTVDALSAHLTTNDGDDAPLSITPSAEFNNWAQLDIQIAKVFKFD